MVKILALYPSPHSHSLSSPTRPLSSLPVSSLFSYPSSLFSTRLLPLLLPVLSLLYPSPPSSLPVLLLPLLLLVPSLFSTRPPPPSSLPVPLSSLPVLPLLYPSSVLPLSSPTRPLSINLFHRTSARNCNNGSSRRRNKTGYVWRSMNFTVLNSDLPPYSSLYPLM